MADINKIKAGDVLWHTRKRRMGNTTIRTVDLFKVVVIEVDAEKKRALISWNGNHGYWTSNIKNLRVNKPQMITYGLLGQQRLALRGEKGGAA